MTAIDKYTLKQLKGLAKKRGLSTKGKRGDLIKRLRPKKKGRQAQSRIPMHYYSEELNTLKIGRGKPFIRQRRIAIIPKNLQLEERRNAVRHLINNQTAELVNLREQGKLTQDQLGTAIDKINDLHNIETERRQKRSVSARKGAETRRTEREQRRQLELMEQRAREKNKELEMDSSESSGETLVSRLIREDRAKAAEERKRAFEKNKALMSIGDSESDAKAAREEFMTTQIGAREGIEILQRKMAEDDEKKAEPKTSARADSGMASGTEGRDKERVKRRLKKKKRRPLIIEDPKEKDVKEGLIAKFGVDPEEQKPPSKLPIGRTFIRTKSGDRLPLALSGEGREEEVVPDAPVAEARFSTGDPNV